MLTKTAKKTKKIIIIVGLLICFLIIFVASKLLTIATMNYQFSHMMNLDCIKKNLSGITFNKDRGSFFVISNAPEQIAEINAKGECLQSFMLDDYEDTEDIYHLKNNLYFFVEERKFRINLVRLNPEQSDSIELIKSIDLKINNKTSKGIEGIAFNQANNSIMVVAEFPRRIIEVKNWDTENENITTNELNSEVAELMLRDFAAITPFKEGYLLLSEKSKRLLFIDQHGKVKEKLSLKDNGSSDFIEQPEGVAVDTNNTILIAGEPNQLAIFKRTKR